MVFSSITFLFFFLPAILLFYHLSGRWKNHWLLFTSLLFYAWGEGAYLLILIVSIIGNYLLGRMLRENGGNSLVSKGWLFLALLYNFSILGFFKYANFLVENLNPLLSAIGFPVIQLGPVHLPIGISFFTFQAVSYLVDVYRGVVEPQKNIINLGLYISLFPQLIAGPIVRYHDIAASLIKRSVSHSDLAYGIRRFLFGLSKKVLLANPLGLVADKIFVLPQNELSVPVAWLGAVCYHADLL
jgi:alginate O-acetyltransferase complex protein AlgI